MRRLERQQPGAERASLRSRSRRRSDERAGVGVRPAEPERAAAVLVQVDGAGPADDRGRCQVGGELASCESVMAKVGPPRRRPGTPRPEKKCRVALAGRWSPRVTPLIALEGVSVMVAAQVSVPPRSVTSACRSCLS